MLTEQIYFYYPISLDTVCLLGVENFGLYFFFSESVTSYSRHLEKKHDMLLGLLFDRGSYKKLYSYRHLINGFAVHVSADQVKSEYFYFYLFVYNSTFFCASTL